MMGAVNRRLAYETSVDVFEQALCDFIGSPLAVATDSCTNAIFMALKWHQWQRPIIHRPFGDTEKIALPKWTYVGVVQAIRNAGCLPLYTEEKWQGSYRLSETAIVDSAKRFERDMYQPGTLTCVSFGTSKLLPIGRGGAILLDDQDAADWIRPRTMDGRTAGEDYLNPTFVTPAWRVNMTPEQAVRGLDLLTYYEDMDKCDWTEYPDLSKAVWK